MNRQIILIDDDEDDRHIFREAVLNSGVNTPFTEYTTGEAFITDLKGTANTLQRLIFLDINMPRSDGYTILSEIRQSEQYANCHIIMYTTSSDPQDIKFAEQSSASGFAAKPSDYNKLEELVKNAVQHFFKPQPEEMLFFSML